MRAFELHRTAVFPHSIRVLGCASAYRSLSNRVRSQSWFLLIATLSAGSKLAAFQAHRTWKGNSFHVQLGLGGQISADRLWKEIPSLKQWLAQSGKENRKTAAWTAAHEEDVTHAYFIGPNGSNMPPKMAPVERHIDANAFINAQEERAERTTRVAATLAIAYFLLFITFVHISSSPTLASLSGNTEIARAALST